MTEVFLNLTEVFPCFFLSCKAKCQGKTRTDGARPALYHISCICVVQLLFVLFYVLFVCKCVLPPGDNTIAVNKYIKTCQFVYSSVTKMLTTLFGPAVDRPPLSGFE